MSNPEVSWTSGRVQRPRSAEVEAQQTDPDRRVAAVRGRQAAAI